MYFRKTGLLIISILLAMPLLLSCFRDVENRKFEAFTNAFFSWYFRANPISATWIGVHDYDHLLDDMSPEAMKIRLKTLKDFKLKMKEIDLDRLSAENNIDYRILMENLDEMIFHLEELKEYQWNPINYVSAVGFSIMQLITQDFAPLEERLRNVYLRAGAIPAFLEQAKENLKTAPRIHVETAIKQNRGTIAIFKKEIYKYSEGAPEELLNRIRIRSDTTISALKDFGKWLEQSLLPAADKDFRLGPELYYRKLKFTLKSLIKPDEILERAERSLAETQKEMFKISLPIYEKWFGPLEKFPDKHTDSLMVIRRVLDKIAESHVGRDEVVANAERQIDKLIAFVKGKNLITLDDRQPLEIRETPEYMRGIAIAFLESPGPLEKGLKTFYDVQPIPEEWTDEQVESYLREYNDYSVQILSIHEAIPGHYVQLYYSNRYPSLIRGIFSSGPMVEGWAHYAERMMVDNGYGGGDPAIKLVQLKWYLRGIANAIIDQKIHAGNMTEDEALNLMINETFQEESEAKGKWVRARLTSTQLSTYFVGIQEILDLKRDYMKLKGEAFNLKEFHEELLSYGSPPVKYLREILLR